MTRQRIRLALATVLVGLPALLACSLLSRFNATPTPLPTPTATLPPVIESFDGSPEALDEINQALLDNPSGLAQQAQAYLQSEDVKLRFAAVYGLSLAVDESNADQLLPVLQDPDIRLRTIAAGSLIGLGRKESIPILITALGSNEFLPMSHPPRSLSTLARQALPHYTGQDFGTGPGDAPAWQAWWDQAGARLQWDAAAGRYGP